MGWYSVAQQLRNICGMPPWLISQTGYALMTEEGGQEYGGPGRVTVLCTAAATVVSLLIAGGAACLAPWILRHVYGAGYAGAELAATLAIATGLTHMSAAPAAARLTVVSLPLTGAINGIWTVAIIGLGTWLAQRGGAAGAAATFLAAHLLSAVLVLGTLLWLEAAPRALAAVSAPSLAGSAVLAGLGWLRSTGSSHKDALSFAMLAASLLLTWISFVLASKDSPADQRVSISDLFSRVMARATGGSHA
jgi:hypothetical protein